MNISFVSFFLKKKTHTHNINKMKKHIIGKEIYKIALNITSGKYKKSKKDMLSKAQ
jgi:hypothetical protein